MKCNKCGSNINRNFNFCPDCGHNIKQEREMKNYGILGRDNFIPQNNSMPQMPFGLDKMLNSLMGQLNKELGQMGKEVKINFSSNIPGLNPNINNQERPTLRLRKNIITPEKLEKISKLPRQEAKSGTKRIGNTIIYNLEIPGVKSVQDIIINKTESGIEIKAISDKVLYTKTISLNKLMRYRLLNGILSVEFQGS